MALTRCTEQRVVRGFHFRPFRLGEKGKEKKQAKNEKQQQQRKGRTIKRESKRHSLKIS